MIFYYLTGILLFLWLYILWSRREFYKLIFKLPGPLGYPIVGMAHHLIKREEILQVLEAEEQKYGRTFFSWLGPFPFLVIGDPQIAQDILTSPHCVNKSFLYKAVDDGTGKGLFSLANPKWNSHRRLLNPAFGHKVLLNFIPVFNQEVNKLLQNLDMFLTEEIDLTKIFPNFTLKIAALTTMGDTLPSDGSNHFNEGLLSCYKCVQESVAKMCFSPWLNFRAFNWLWKNNSSYTEAKSEIRNYIRKLIIGKTKDELENSEHKSTLDPNIFINRAIDLVRKGHFDWQNVEDECKIIVFGAFETTSNTIVYILTMLAMFPQYQEEVYEEVKSIFSSKDDDEVSYDEIQQMVYLDMVINETMRVMAPVPLVARQTEHEVRLSNGVVIPKGLQVAIDIFNMHRRTDIWGPEAHIFNPDNFLPANLNDKHPYAFIPFTKGIRNCIGWKYALLSIKVTIAKLIWKFRFTTSFEYQRLHFVEDITIKLKEIPLFRIYERNKCLIKHIVKKIKEIDSYKSVQRSHNLHAMEGLSVLFLCLCGVVSAFAIYFVYFKRDRYHLITSQLPTVKGLPFLGIAYKLMPMEKLLYVLESYFAKFESWSYCAWIGPQPFLVTVDLEMIKEILTSNIFLEKSSTMYSFIDKAIPNGIVTSPVEKWKHNRKLMNTAFTHKAITNFIPIFTERTQALVDKINGCVGKGECKVSEIIKHTFLDMALETTMGMGLYRGQEQHDEIVYGFNYMLEQVATGAMLSAINAGFLACTPKYYRTQGSIKYYIERLIKDKRKAKKATVDNMAFDCREKYEEGNIKKNADAFIDRALNFQARGLFDQNDVINETKTIIAGSFDTVSTQIFSILIMLAMHPEVQEKLYEETKHTIAQQDAPVDYEYLKKLLYMDMVIKETLRLMPSIPVIGREAIKDATVNGIHLPEGMQIMIPIFILHRRKDLWGPLANSFNPDNFLSENVSKRHPYAYMPFSKGSRNCIGWLYADIVLRVMLLGLIRNFRFSTTFRYENLVFADHISLRYVEEPKLQIYRRNIDLQKKN
ncbi:uncharacterized protein LOC129245066 [Anastrepha obliqua]|uniref:uncharacterized protein LOC129245066 n=1 Tax=Anastrepha obliqua TaxID=95512 RepID=UPI002409AAA3|nr:uncharacterized protein LOC129245066 [Anastrepha obliqua]